MWFIVASSEYIFRKPHRRIFEIALKKADLCGSEVWYAGDNPYFDVSGAANCGINPIWYRGAISTGQILHEHIPRCEYLEIDAWYQLKRILADEANS